MSKFVPLLMAIFTLMCVGIPAWADEDTSVVDLSDVDTDQPVYGPSFENETPAGYAPGEPILDEDEAEEAQFEADLEALQEDIDSLEEELDEEE